jgi:signal peptidase II
MAYGIELGGDLGKLALSVFRIVFVTGIAWYIVKLIKEKQDQLYVFSIALIFSGAVGNIIDSVLYGVIFSDSMYGVAQFLPVNGGYSSLLYGKVVDMFYFPLLQGYFPEWFPFWGNERFIFFRPVFNLADASISIGVFMIIAFQKRFLETIED